MQSIADLWWLWAIALLISAVLLIRRMFGQIKDPASMSMRSMQGTALSFLPVWAFGALFALSLILNIIDFAKS